MNVDLSEKFERWFVAPLNLLRTGLSQGDGSFIAMAIGFQLCERFYRTKTLTQDIIDGTAFKTEAARDLGVNSDEFNRFWNAFRNGMQHQGSPKSFARAGVDFKWEISGDFDALPQEYQVDPQTVVIRLDPWKFADLMVQKFRDEPNILNGALSHAFGDIYQRP